MVEAPRPRFLAGRSTRFDLGLPSLISACGFGGIRSSAPKKGV